MNQNILILNDVNTGNNLKQGDQTILKYICGDGSGDVLELEGLKARAVLKNRKNTVVYSAETTVKSNNEIMFMIDKVLPVAKYILEIIVDDKYIFPSDNSLYLNITASSLGSLVEEIESNSLDLIIDDLKSRLEISANNYVHTQQVASDIWEINHSLNKYPSVTIVDTSGNLVIGNVHYISTSKIVVKFSAPFSGVAYLN
ncbi:RES family NAD+ phosphorylase [Eremococcus coleocola]|uniref:RES family NAD+ phosphorylase n=1 Tax=Eremococcus coleocola TaxID=88132 RepID=UPI00040481BA|nr:RES family NAD+ phosphorylase [Eremococcus coleocola]